MCIGWLSLGHICGSHQSIYAGSHLWPIYMALIRAYMWLSLGHICWLYIGHICWLSLVADIHGSHQGIYVALIRAYMLAQIYGTHWLSLLVALISTMTLYIYIYISVVCKKKMTTNEKRCHFSKWVCHHKMIINSLLMHLLVSQRIGSS